MFTSLFLWFSMKGLVMLLISMASALFIPLMDSTVILHFDLNSFIEISTSITIMVDKQSLIFISTVSAVSCMIIFYSFFYMESESNQTKKKFLSILLVFILSMFILSLSANIFWLLIGWDGLGISSFCLIIFYQNWKSLSSGMVTFLSNRFGDTLIIVSMVWIILNSSVDSWVFSVNVGLLSLIFSMGAFSKSAQLPYSFWLPQAMAAPTPVSALVHSSTLVTAGVFLMCRFYPIESDFCLSFLFLVSSITVLMAGSSSLLEFDLKKVIALSTLCHISLMMMFSVLGETTLCLFHLMMHAFFKSLLFMIAGFLIHTNSNSQDIRSISLPGMDLNISFPFLISTLSMMGYPFMSGFYSKEVLLMKSSYDLPSIMMTLMFLINSFFSCGYSFRLIINLFSNKKSIYHLTGSTPFSKIFFFGSMFSSFLGGMVMSAIVLEEEEMVQSPIMKLLLLIVCILGIFLGVKIDLLSINLLMGNWLNSLWKSDYLYKVTQKHFFVSSYSVMWVMDEKGTSKMILKKIMEKSIILYDNLNEVFLNKPLKSVKISHFLFMISFLWIL